MLGVTGVGLSRPLAFDAGPVRAATPPGSLRFPSDFPACAPLRCASDPWLGEVGRTRAQPCACACAPCGVRAWSQPAPSQPEHQSLAAPCWGGGDLPPTPQWLQGSLGAAVRTGVLLSPAAVWQVPTLLEVGESTAALAALHPELGEPRSSLAPLVVASWGVVLRCQAVGCSWCSTSGWGGRTAQVCSPAPTLVLQLPLLQLSLDLV